MNSTAEQRQALRTAVRRTRPIWSACPVHCALWCLCAQAVLAQPSIFGKFISRTWSKAEGLPHDSVTSVLQTHDGFLWVGTQGGLARFDGVTFRKIPFPGLTNSDVWITDLCEDRQGRLFVGTDQRGLFCYAGKGLAQLGPGPSSITGLAVGPGDELWVGTRTGLNRWTGQAFQSIGSREGLPEEPVVSVYAARSGKVWITLRSGVYVGFKGRFEKYHLSAESQSRTPEFLGVYEDQENELWAFGDTYLIKLRESKRFNYFRSGHMPSVRIWSFHEGRDGRMWIGTSGQGFFQFTDERFRPVEMQSGKRPSNVRSICEDLEGNLWLGTDGEGLVQLRQDHLRRLGAAEGLPASSALCLTDYGSNKVLIAYADGSLFVGAHDHFEPYRLLDPTDTQPFARSLCATADGDIWVASAGFGVSCLHEHRRIAFGTANGLSEDFFTCTGVSPSGAVWAATRSGQLYRYQSQRWEMKGTVEAPVTAMLASGTNRLWIGTARGSVWLWQNSKLEPAFRPEPMPEAEVDALAMDSAGRLWAGTRAAGLRCYAPATGKSWVPANPLPDPQICGLVFDAQGNLWLNTPQGVLVGRKSAIEEAIRTSQYLSLRWVAHLEEEEKESAAGKTLLLSRDGLLWLISAGQVMRLDPRLIRTPPRVPPVYIETVRVNSDLVYSSARGDANRDWPAVQTVRIRPGVRALEFEFTSPCLTLPEKARFRYKLEGFDSDWKEGSSLVRRARYGRILPGNYQFRVEACDADGTWNRGGASFAFLVPTPLWQTSWAICAYLVFLVGTAYLASRYVSHRRLRRRLLALEHSEEMSRERMRIAQDMHDEIGSKLARISYLSEGVKTELKGVYPNPRLVDSLANTSRDLLRSLDQMVWAVNPRNDTVEQLVVYLCRYATEFFQDTSILCEFRVPQELPALPLSAEIRHNLFLAFEEALTNTMKHSGAGQVVVEIVCDKDSLQIISRDNGRGFSPDAVLVCDPRSVRVGHGLSGLKRRLDSLGGQCVVSSEPGQGTTVVFKIPLATPRVPL